MQLHVPSWASAQAMRSLTTRSDVGIDASTQRHTRRHRHRHCVTYMTSCSDVHHVVMQCNTKGAQSCYHGTAPKLDAPGPVKPQNDPRVQLTWNVSGFAGSNEAISFGMLLVICSEPGKLRVACTGMTCTHTVFDGQKQAVSRSLAWLVCACTLERFMGCWQSGRGEEGNLHGIKSEADTHTHTQQHPACHQSISLWVVCSQEPGGGEA